MKLFIWVQHLWGRGHLRRTARLAQGAVRAGFAVTVAAGGPGGRAAFADMPGVTACQLPALATADAQYTALQTSDGAAVDDTFWALRLDTLLNALHMAQPDILLIELFPFGRRKFAGEVLALIEAAKTLPTTPAIVCSVRDIVETKTPEKAAQMAGWLRDQFDAVLVHGDETFMRLDETAAFAAAAPLHYTGYIAPRMPAAAKAGVIVSAGSSPSGQALLTVAAQAGAAAASEAVPWHIYVPPEIAPPSGSAHVHVHPYTDEFLTALARADVSISEAGYNTFAEVLGAGAKPVLVPYDQAGQTEQPLRAARATERRLAVTPRELTPAAMLKAVEAARALPPPALDLDGARNAAVILKGLRGGPGAP